MVKQIRTIEEAMGKLSSKVDSIKKMSIQAKYPVRISGSITAVLQDGFDSIAKEFGIDRKTAEQKYNKFLGEQFAQQMREQATCQPE